MMGWVNILYRVHGCGDMMGLPVGPSGTVFRLFGARSGGRLGQKSCGGSGGGLVGFF